ncbi:MAG: Peptidoglycan/xylan/chitin deacetylase, PgdA/CDA1 family [Mucilaginibacter sp.]|nr:Peptidoglycan/xylan/chitin deacetylase, PgdA/CDA1 family [Mucilaginibacter sp.]
MKKLILFLFLANFSVYAQQKSPASVHKKAIIVLTYDDALMSQLNIAIPQLDSAHLNGTFFLTGNITDETLPKWRNAFKHGNELANHTLYHPCLITDGKGNPANNSANYTVYAILREVGMMNNFLHAIDNEKIHTYAYPCTESKVGGVNYIDSLRKSGIVKYARMGGDQNAVITDYNKLDPLLVPSWAVVGKITGDDLIAFVKKVQKDGGMGVFMFHGVGGDYLTTSAQAHRALLNYLNKHRDEVWVTTFKQAMDYLTGVKQ